MANGDEDDERLWSISVKTVGAERQSNSGAAGGRRRGKNTNNDNNDDNDDNDDDNDNYIPPCFDVVVKPSDNVQSLHDRIEHITGLKESQQRLIYRGRVIKAHQDVTDNQNDLINDNDNDGDDNDNEDNNSSNNRDEAKDSFSKRPRRGEPTKISEIRGLADGHTIHLVRRHNAVASSSSSPAQQSLSSSPNRTTTGGETNRNRPSSSSTESDNNNGTELSNSSNSTSSASTATSSLLAALLGLSALEDEDEETATEEAAAAATTAGMTTTTSPNAAAQQRSGAAGASTTTTSSSSSSSGATTSWRQRGGRRNRPNYRLTAEDLEVPDPGSMESVRQGLMTLHTLLPIAEIQLLPLLQPQQPQPFAAFPGEDSSTTFTTSTPRSSVVSRNINPLEHARRWYLGQCIDCRDTVNQWLEATIVEIVRPEEILPPSGTDAAAAVTTTTATPSSLATATTNSANNNNTNTAAANDTMMIQPAMDPAVGAADLEGRRRLLLEPCLIGEVGDLGGDLAGYRPRSTNRNVLLLLIHYNGWPHRWDEWIRSDSERIRPFRVRTRHPTTSPWVSPVAQSYYADAPPTFISSGHGASAATDAQDRAYLLRELVRVITAVNTLTQHVDAAFPPPSNGTPTPSSDLPWSTTATTTTTATAAAGTNRGGTGFPNEQEEAPVAPLGGSGDDSLSLPFSAGAAGPTAVSEAAVVPYSASGAAGGSIPNLDILAPLIDRLGRTLVDAAPHIASWAASQNSRNKDHVTASLVEEEEEEEEEEENEILGDNNSNSNNNNNNSNSNSLGGLLSLLNRDRSRRISGTSQATDQALSPVSDNNGGSGSSQQHPPVAAAAAAVGVVDPDYMDFASGLVNVARGGDVRTSGSGGGGSRNGTSRNGGGGNTSNRDEISGLLGAYLAAASLGGLTTSLGGGEGDDGSGGDGGDMQGLGRFLRTQGGGGNNNNNNGNNGGGGGIDIHIHAVVTAPGMSPTGGGGGGTALAFGLGGGGGGTTTVFPATDLFANTRRATAQRVRATLMEQQSHDTGIFDDLYSENPDPVSSSSSPTSASSSSSAAAAAANDSTSSMDHHRSNPAGGAAVDHLNDTSSSLSSSSQQQRLSTRGGNSSNNNNNRSRNSSNHPQRNSFLGRLFRRSGSSD